MKRRRGKHIEEAGQRAGHHGVSQGGWAAPAGYANRRQQQHVPAGRPINSANAQQQGSEHS